MILLVAPLRSEIAPIAESLRERGHASVSVQLGRIEGQQFPSLDLVLTHGGHGKTQFGVQTQHLLDHTSDVEAVVCIGAAGALSERLGVGDLVIATETVEHDYTERFSPHPLPRFAGDSRLIESFRGLLLDSLPFTVHFGIVASGDEDVIELERGAALRQATEACAVAWEGAGGARAARFNDLPFLELRGVTDTADYNASAHFRENLRSAMGNAAALLVLWREAMRG